MLELTKEEQAWLDAYRKALDKKHPGTVQEMLIYGSKARGQAHAESEAAQLSVGQWSVTQCAFYEPEHGRS